MQQLSGAIKKKWMAAIVVILKDEALYAEQWITYHLSLGFEHFFVYDNGSSDDISAVLRKFIIGGVVTLISWPVRAGQIDAYSHAINMLQGCCEWVGFFDTDEYVVLHHHDNINSFLDEVDADQVLLPWRQFAYGGHKLPPGGTDVENYFWAQKIGPDTQVQVKHLVRCSKVRFVTAHFSNVDSGMTIMGDGKRVDRPSHFVIGPTYIGAQLNHYSTRSYAENVSRRKKGEVNGGPERQVASFYPLTAKVLENLEYDASILRHLEAVVLTQQIWRNVAQTPHRYGLMQRNEILSSWNNLPFYFCKSYANYLGGVEEVSHGTNFELTSVSLSGKERPLRSFWNNLELSSIHFRVDQHGILPFFMGTIHYGDFARRFGFEVCCTQRDFEIHDVWCYELNYSGRCIAVIFELDGSDTVMIDAVVAGRSVAKYEIPLGHHAGLFYHPVYLHNEAKVSLNIYGACRVKELIIGALP